MIGLGTRWDPGDCGDSGECWCGDVDNTGDVFNSNVSLIFFLGISKGSEAIAISHYYPINDFQNAPSKPEKKQFIH